MPNLLTFTAADIRFAVPLDQIVRVVPLVALKVVPKADPCVVGVMNMGGAGVPVVDLSIRLDLAEKRPYTVSTSIVICDKAGQWYGVIADSISGVQAVADTAVELSGLVIDEDVPYLGMGRAPDGQHVLILDLDRVLDLSFDLAPLPPLPEAVPV